MTPQTEGILLVDAKNACNCLNREAALNNVQYICLSLSRTLHNCYQAPSRLFVAGSGELASREGTTPEDPLSMPFYALATLPLVRHLQEACPTTRQVWYADDSGGVDRLRKLRVWWEVICSVGKRYGYFTNSAKTVLLVRAHLVTLAHELFEGTGVQIATNGARYLGSAIGDQAFRGSFLAQRSRS